MRALAFAFAAAVLAPADMAATLPAAVHTVRALPLADTAAVLALTIAAASFAADKLFPTRF